MECKDSIKLKSKGHCEKCKRSEMSAYFFVKSQEGDDSYTTQRTEK